MKKIVKIISWLILMLIIVAISLGTYIYQTNDMVRAMVNSDESKLYYFPSKTINEMKDLKYSETLLTVNKKVEINTYQFQHLTKNAKANIFFIHGSGGNVSRYQKMIKPLVNYGFNVYALDWRGYGKSTGVPDFLGVLEDTQLAFKHFLQQTKDGTLRTIVYGMSLGGQLAVKITKDNQNKIDALILDSSIESAQSLAFDYVPFEFLKHDIKKHPEKFNQVYVALDDIQAIKNIPKLIIHSKNDEEVPFIRGKNLFKAAKEPKELWVVDSQHIMILVDKPKEVIKKIDLLMNINTVYN